MMSVAYANKLMTTTLTCGFVFSLLIFSLPAGGKLQQFSACVPKNGGT